MPFQHAVTQRWVTLFRFAVQHNNELSKFLGRKSSNSTAFSIQLSSNFRIFKETLCKWNEECTLVFINGNLVSNEKSSMSSRSAPIHLRSAPNTLRCSLECILHCEWAHESPFERQWASQTISHVPSWVGPVSWCAIFRVPLVLSVVLRNITHDYIYHAVSYDVWRINQVFWVGSGSLRWEKSHPPCAQAHYPVLLGK